MTLGGAPAVLVAAFIVRALPLATLRWGVVAVVTYAGALMLHAALGARTGRTSSLADKAGARSPG
jgi:hypothetical protein